MPTNIVYALELGAGRQWIRRIFIAVLFLALAALYVVTQFRGFRDVESMDYAQVARQIARGKGFTTQFVRPAELALLKGNRVNAVEVNGVVYDKVDWKALPEIYAAPVYPYVIGAIFKAFRISFDVDKDKLREMRIYPPERVIIFFNLTCLLLTSVLVYFLAVRMFDEPVGILATALFLMTDLVWQFSLTGLSTSWVMLLVTGVLFCLHEALCAESEDMDRAVWMWLLAGSFVLALAILSRFSLLWLVVPWIGFVLLSFRARLGLAAAALAIVLTLTLPWGVRNYKVSGNVLGGNAMMLGAGELAPDRRVKMREYQPTQEESVIRVVFRKVLVGIKHVFVEFFALTGAAVAGVMFWAGLMHPFRRSPTQKLRFFLVISMVFAVLGSALYDPMPEAISEANALAVWIPPLLILGCGFFYVMLDRLDLSLVLLRYAAIVLFGFLGAVPMLMTLAPPAELPFRYPPYFPPVIRLASNSWLEPNEVMMSDMPWATAWYGDRTSLWIPTQMKDFYYIHDYINPVSALLLTPFSGNEPMISTIDKGEYKDWAMIIRRQGLPTSFPITSYTVLPPNENEYFLISNRVRWK
jgi:hypothetical protein